MHVLETKVTKEKVLLLGIVRPPQRYYADFLNCQEYLVSLVDPLHTMTTLGDSPKAH